MTGTVAIVKLQMAGWLRTCGEVENADDRADCGAASGVIPGMHPRADMHAGQRPEVFGEY